jgi:hypothetical protein
MAIRPGGPLRRSAPRTHEPLSVVTCASATTTTSAPWSATCARGGSPPQARAVRAAEEADVARHPEPPPGARVYYEEGPVAARNGVEPARDAPDSRK